MMKTNKLYNGDCLNVMQKFVDDESIDMIFCDFDLILNPKTVQKAAKDVTKNCSRKSKTKTAPKTPKRVFKKIRQLSSKSNIS